MIKIQASLTFLLFRISNSKTSDRQCKEMIHLFITLTYYQIVIYETTFRLKIKAKSVYILSLTRDHQHVTSSSGPV